MRKAAKKPHIILVGAGPGDPELITLKGMRALQSARVILYDALVSPLLLCHAPEGCKLVNVGKRRGKHTFSQDEINQLLVFYAYRYGHVVRLKGGDPYVFGRGHEEVEYAEKRGITTEVIPGISSALAAPASVGIPVTKRGINESFWVVTGTCAQGDIPADMLLAAQSTATVVVLMGMNNLREIVSVFHQHRGALEPAAIIQQATCPEEKFIRGTLANLEALATENDLKAPAVIVIGKVVEESRLRQIVEPLQNNTFTVSAHR